MWKVDFFSLYLNVENCLNSFVNQHKTAAAADKYLTQNNWDLNISLGEATVDLLQMLRFDIFACLIVVEVAHGRGVDDNMVEYTLLSASVCMLADSVYILVSDSRDQGCADRFFCGCPSRPGI